MTGWRLPDGRILFVHDGISSGKTWATYYRKPSGSLKRVASKDLPLRPTRAEAQSDLDRWAGHQRWATPTEVD